MRLTKIGLTFILMVASCVTLFAVGFLLWEIYSNTHAQPVSAPVTVSDASSRVLVIAPHNDDEIISCGGYISRSLKSGAEVRVVMITNGDGQNAARVKYLKPFPNATEAIRFGYIRQQETLRALKDVGLDAHKVTFLGYPDSGVDDMWEKYWDNSHPYFNALTQTNHCPYRNSYTQNAPYSGESLVSDLGRIIQSYRPDIVIYPASNDNNHDHWATNVFVRCALTTTEYHPREQLVYVVHRGDWPCPIMVKADNKPLLPPKKLVGIGMQWQTLKLTPEEVRQRDTALNCFRTQQITSGALLTAFKRQSELFGVYSDLALSNRNRLSTEITPDDRNVVIQDPLQDRLPLLVNRDADIREVNVERAQDGSLDVFIRTYRPVNKKYCYQMTLVFFDHGVIRRLNLEYSRGRLLAKNIGTPSITNISDVRVQSKGTLLQFSVPRSVTAEYRQVLINAASFTGGHVLDRTAWRMLVV